MSPNHGFTLFIIIFMLFFNDSDLTHCHEITKQKEFKKTKIKWITHAITLFWFGREISHNGEFVDDRSHGKTH